MIATRNAIAECVGELLSQYIGEHTGRIAVRTFSIRAFGRGPETLTMDDVPALQDALRPMLRTLVGRARCEVVLAKIPERLAGVDPPPATLTTGGGSKMERFTR